MATPADIRSGSSAYVLTRTERARNSDRLPSAGCLVDPISQRNAVKLSGVELLERRQQTGQIATSREGEELLKKQANRSPREVDTGRGRRTPGVAGAGNSSGEGNAQLIQEPKRMSIAVERVRPKVPANLDHARGSRPGHPGGWLVSRTMTDRPARAHERGHKESGQTASDHDHIRVVWHEFLSFPSFRLLTRQTVYFSLRQLRVLNL